MLTGRGLALIETMYFGSLACCAPRFTSTHTNRLDAVYLRGAGINRLSQELVSHVCTPLKSSTYLQVCHGHDSINKVQISRVLRKQYEAHRKTRQKRGCLRQISDESLYSLPHSYSCSNAQGNKNKRVKDCGVRHGPSRQATVLQIARQQTVWASLPGFKRQRAFGKTETRYIKR